MFVYGDNPVAVSLDFLRRIDGESPARWMASTKWDGHRKFVYKHNGKWIWKSKPSGAGSTINLPDGLRHEFEEMDLPGGMVYDCEHVGTRLVEHSTGHHLYVFDWYPLEGPCPPFIERHMGLGSLLFGDNIRFVNCWSNPGLVERFSEQLLNPLSEGLVVRRSDSTIIGSVSRCMDNAHVLKVKYREIRELKKELPR